MFCSSDILLSLSIVSLILSVLCTQIDHCLLSIITRHAPTADWLQVCFGSDTVVKSVFQILLSALLILYKGLMNMKAGYNTLSHRIMLNGLFFG